MATVSRTLTMAAPAQTVWRMLSDFGAISAWAPGVDHSCVLEHGPSGGPVGTCRRIQTGRTTLVERITESAPPTTLAYRIEGLPRRMGEVANRWTLEPEGEATTVTLTSSVQIGANPVARLAERALCRVIARQSDAMLAGLADYLKGRT